LYHILKTLALIFQRFIIFVLALTGFTRYDPHYSYGKFESTYGVVNDLLLPFRHLRGGTGIGTLFVLRAVDEPETADPAGETLLEFNVLWGDTYQPES
jgi:hypothetical protein